MLLALDTATQFASIALYDGRQVLAELSWRSERRHTVELAPQVDALLKLAGAAPPDLTALAVSIGPGSYTGARIALSFAKGMVSAASLPLIGIPTLDALAYPHVSSQCPVCALVAAGRGRYCWATYAAASGVPQRTSDWGLNPFPDILPTLTPPLRFAGELSVADQTHLRTVWPDHADIVSPGVGCAPSWRFGRVGLVALADRRHRRSDIP